MGVGESSRGECSASDRERGMTSRGVYARRVPKGKQMVSR